MTEQERKIKERVDELVRGINKEEYEAWLAEEELKSRYRK